MLTAALSQAGKVRCPVAVAKLDRQSRDVNFIWFGPPRSLLVAELDPDVDPFILHRGIKLGGSKLSEARKGRCGHRLAWISHTTDGLCGR